MPNLFWVLVDIFRFYTSAKLKKPQLLILGSARFDSDHDYSKSAYKLAQLASHSNWAILTGGGPGIMREANRAAFENKKESTGFFLKLPNEQKPNSFMKKILSFRYFFTRKLALLYSADAIVVFPGGFGTLDELFEILSLIQNKCMQKIPVLLFGKNFYEPLMLFMNQLKIEKTIQAEDLLLFKISDDVHEIMSEINQSSKSKIQKNLYPNSIEA